jgi:hypothetical protein
MREAALSGSVLGLLIASLLFGQFSAHGYDALSMVEHFGSRIGDTNWDDSIDMNGDLQIDIYDAILLARFVILQPVILDVDCSVPFGQGYGDIFYPATVTVHYYEPDNDTLNEMWREGNWSQYSAYVVHPEVNWVDITNTTHLEPGCGAKAVLVDPDHDGTNWTNVTMTRDGNNSMEYSMKRFPLLEKPIGLFHMVCQFGSVTL